MEPGQMQADPAESRPAVPTARPDKSKCGPDRTKSPGLHGRLRPARRSQGPVHSALERKAQPCHHTGVPMHRGGCCQINGPCALLCLPHRSQPFPGRQMSSASSPPCPQTAMRSEVPASEQGLTRARGHPSLCAAQVPQPCQATSPRARCSAAVITPPTLGTHLTLS